MIMELRSVDSMFVGEIVAEWPDTSHAFNRRKMACPGCTMSPFMTVRDVCTAYGVDYSDLLKDLQRVVAGDPHLPERAECVTPVGLKPTQSIPDRK